MSLNKILYLRSFATNLRIILSNLIYSYFVYSVLTLYKSYCSSVISFLSFTFMDVVILVFFYRNWTTSISFCRSVMRCWPYLERSCQVPATTPAKPSLLQPLKCFLRCKYNTTRNPYNKVTGCLYVCLSVFTKGSRSPLNRSGSTQQSSFS